MTRLEESVWAATYVQHLAALYAHGYRNTRTDAHYSAVVEADNTVLVMRRGTGDKGGRFHYDDQLEQERLGANTPLYRMPNSPSEP